MSETTPIRPESTARFRFLFLAILAVGIFLRISHFSEWLYFYPDQARDVTLVDDVLSGRASWPLLGPIAASTPFRLGPVSAYFQIASGAAFGVSPQSVAIPDLLFGILSIPLLYVFLRRILSERTSLALMGLYAVSFPAIRYARFAWNSNSIPFFSLLLLLSLSEFLHAKSKTAWPWVMALGITFGIGVQLHTVLLVLLPLMLLAAIAYSIRFDRKAWLKWLAIVTIALILNTGQIISELRTGFKNTGYFFSVLDDRSPHEGAGMTENLALDAVCHAQADALFVSSLPATDDTCAPLTSFRYSLGGYADRTSYVFFLTSISFGFGLFVLGNALLAFRLKKEQDLRKKVFLGAVLLSSILTFVVMLPVVGHNGQVRYLLPIIAVPFFSLGLMAEYVSEKFSKQGIVRRVPIVVLGILVLFNLSTIVSEAKRHAAGVRSDAQYVVWDELEAVRDSIVTRSSPRQEAYLFGGQKYLQNYYKPLAYALSLRGFTLQRSLRHIEDVPAGAPVFFIAQSLENPKKSEYDARPEDLDLTIESYERIGNLGLYKLQH
jgi:4-amino-4-deoxy-L-arabinose transferase-like glycosyltransferase